MAHSLLLMRGILLCTLLATASCVSNVTYQSVDGERQVERRRHTSAPGAWTIEKSALPNALVSESSGDSVVDHFLDGSVGSQPSPGDKEALDFIFEGGKYEAEGRQQDAKGSYRAAFESADSPRLRGVAHILLGFLLLEARDTDRAREHITSSLELDPRNPQALLLKKAISDEPITDRDIQDLASRSELETADALLLAGRALLASGRTSAGLRLLARAVSLRPTLDITYGHALLLARHVDEGIQVLHKTALREPGNAIAHFLLGVAYWERGEHSKSSRELVLAAELGFAPRGPEQQLAMCHAYMHAGMVSRGFETLLEATRHGADPQEVVLESAAALVVSGVSDQRLTTDEGIRLMRRALKQHPLLPEFHAALGVLLNDAGQHMEALGEMLVADKLAGRQLHPGIVDSMKRQTDVTKAKTWARERLRALGCSDGNDESRFHDTERLDGSNCSDGPEPSPLATDAFLCRPTAMDAIDSSCALGVSGHGWL